MFRVSNLGLKYAENKVFTGLSFEMQSGKVVGLLGENGCGKTSLFKCIIGAVAFEGSCTLDDENLKALSPKELASRIAYMPQSSGISIEMTALDVVLMGFNARLALLESPDKAMKEEAINVLRSVGIEDFNKSYQALSQGQKQLCVFARCLAQDAKLMLLDEPESALDYPNRRKVLTRIRSWVSEKNSDGKDRCALVTLHDPILALNYCDEILCMGNGSSIIKVIPKDISSEDLSEILSAIYGKVEVKEIETNNKEKKFVVI